MAETTIWGHIADLIKTEKIKDFQEFISEEVLNQVLLVKKSIDDPEKLKPYFDALNQKVPYHEIRIALSVIELKGL